MHLERWLGTVSALAMLATAPLPAGARATDTGVVAQATQAPTHAETEKVECVRWQHAYMRLAAIKDEFTQLHLALVPNDDIHPRLDAVTTQTSDIMTSLEERERRCPAKDKPS